MKKLSVIVLLLLVAIGVGSAGYYIYDADKQAKKQVRHFKLKHDLKGFSYRDAGVDLISQALVIKQPGWSVRNGAETLLAAESLLIKEIKFEGETLTELDVELRGINRSIIEELSVRQGQPLVGSYFDSGDSVVNPFDFSGLLALMSDSRHQIVFGADRLGDIRIKASYTADSESLVLEFISADRNVAEVSFGVQAEGLDEELMRFLVNAIAESAGQVEVQEGNTGSETLLSLMSERDLQHVLQSAAKMKLQSARLELTDLGGISRLNQYLSQKAYRMPSEGDKPYVSSVLTSRYKDFKSANKLSVSDAAVLDELFDDTHLQRATPNHSVILAVQEKSGRYHF